VPLTSLAGPQNPLFPLALPHHLRWKRWLCLPYPEGRLACRLAWLMERVDECTRARSNALSCRSEGWPRVLRREGSRRLGRQNRGGWDTGWSRERHTRFAVVCNLVTHEDGCETPCFFSFPLQFVLAFLARAKKEERIDRHAGLTTLRTNPQTK